MVDDDLIINDPFADEDDLLGEEKTETKVRRKKCLVIRWKPQWSASSATR